MRLALFLLLATSTLLAHAEQPPLPDNLQPLEPPPPFEASANTAPEDAPEVTIIKKTEQTVEEFRVSGRLYMIKVTPKHGTPYYLIDEIGDGRFQHRDGLGSNIRPPQWILFNF